MRRIYLVMLSCAVMSGCAGNDLIVQRQVTLEGRLEQIMHAQKTASADIAHLVAQVQELKQQSTRPPAESELLSRCEKLEQKLEIFSGRLVQVESTAKMSATIELVNQENIQQGHEESVQAAYINAFGLFSANNYSDAAEAFNLFISTYPESEYAANARYWLGECYFSLGRYNEAIDSFSRVLEMNPAPKRAADTLLMIGKSWYRLDNPSKGSATLLLLIEKYPGSDAAELAGKQQIK